MHQKLLHVMFTSVAHHVESSRSCSFRLLVLVIVLVLVRAATVVVLRYLIAVELRFLQPLIDDIVDETAPLRCSLL
jgi:hypothetical protein